MCKRRSESDSFLESEKREIREWFENIYGSAWENLTMIGFLVILTLIIWGLTKLFPA